MNERELHNILESIAQEEIPDDMQLWHKIESRLNTPNTRRTTGLNRLGRAAVYLLAALALTTAGYAFYQQLIQVGGDPGIIAVQDLVTPIDQTQRHPTQDVNVTIKWVGHPARIAILELLLKSPSCICGDIVEKLPLAQATVSQHLRELKEAGLIKGRISGTAICYCLEEKTLEYLSAFINRAMEKIDQIKSSCCS